MERPLTESETQRSATIATDGSALVQITNGSISNDSGIPVETVSPVFAPLRRYPLANELLDKLVEEEATIRSKVVPAREIELSTEAQLRVQGESFSYSTRATHDLASLAAIPGPFFEDLDPDLKAMNFNRLLAKKTPLQAPLTIVWNGNTVDRIHRGRLVLPPRAEIIEAILNQSPRATNQNDIHAVAYALNGHVDLSLVTAALHTEPRTGDLVCGGVHLSIETNGAIQLGPATFRLACLNGAMARICFGQSGHVRLRRGDGKNSQMNILKTIREFANAAWQSWSAVSEGLKLLADHRIENADVESLILRLRQSPFFISASVAKHVRAALVAEMESNSTMYGVFNAITSVGSHRHDLLERYRYRLRLGAGQLTMNGVEVCEKCRQLRLGKSRTKSETRRNAVASEE